MKLRLSILPLLCLLSFQNARAQSKIKINTNIEHQTIHSFGASDCWRVQYVGENWEREKREEIADLLFSTDVEKDGSPRGIGLTMWRFNIGAGTHEAPSGGDVTLDWRRSESMLNSKGEWDWSKQSGQQWFLEAARKRGVKYSLGFSIAAPYFMTKNGLGYSSHAKHLNLKDECYDDFARYLVSVTKKLKLDYISPLNEPQWDWTTGNQEGTPATNEEALKLIYAMDSLMARGKVKIVFGEAGDIRYLYRDSTDRPSQDNQLRDIFSKLNNKKSVAHIVSGHSYWSTYPIDTMQLTRKELRSAINRELGEDTEYWQSEYCPMETNPDNSSGGWGRDLGMGTALYVARVIHYDMTLLDATSWQWWTALSQWDYKDGLIYLDGGDGGGAKSNSDILHSQLKTDGSFRASKTMWALGNFSRFVRPDMVRVDCEVDNQDANLLVSAYKSKKREITIVLINSGDISQEITLDLGDFLSKSKCLYAYETSDNKNLRKTRVANKKISLSPRSVTTISTLK